MATTELTDTDRYTIISVDGHAGAALLDYRPYLASKWHEEFDAWAASYTNPFSDLLASTAYRNWDSEQRLAETTSQGVIAEVLFPNTIRIISYRMNFQEIRRRYHGQFDLIYRYYESTPFIQVLDVDTPLVRPEKVQAA